MITTSITNFRENIYNLTKNTIQYNEPLIITTKEGNAILINEEEYNGIIATLELCSDKNIKDKLMSGLNEKLKDCIDETEVDW